MYQAKNIIWDWYDQHSSSWWFDDKMPTWITWCHLQLLLSTNDGICGHAQICLFSHPKHRFLQPDKTPSRLLWDLYGSVILQLWKPLRSHMEHAAMSPRKSLYFLNSKRLSPFKCSDKWCALLCSIKHKTTRWMAQGLNIR